MPQKSTEDFSHPPVPVTLPIQRRIGVAIMQYGESEVVARALSLIAGHNEGEDFLLFVGGEHAQGVLDGAPALYWPELWGVRTLLYVWDDSAISAVLRSLGNPAWRVREMAARVVAARGLPAADELLVLLADEVPRVRIAAARALGAVGRPEDLDRIRPLLKDPLIEVRRGARESIEALRSRFPRNAQTGS